MLAVALAERKVLAVSTVYGALALTTALESIVYPVTLGTITSLELSVLNVYPAMLSEPSGFSAVCDTFVVVGVTRYAPGSNA